MRRDLQSGIERELYRDSNVATYPFSLSPDGRQLVFAVVDTTGELSVLAQEGALLMRLDLATGTIRELTEIGEAGTVESVTWTADGNHLVYPQYSDSGTTIWRVALYGGEPQRITDTFRFRGAIAADGTRIAYTTGGISSKSMVMENLWAVLQRRN